MDTHVTVAGNLTDHPELRFTPTGDQVCTRLAQRWRFPEQLFNSAAQEPEESSEVAGLRDVLLRYDATSVRYRGASQLGDLERLHRSIDGAWSAFQGSHYAQLSSMLPGLITSCQAVAGECHGEQQQPTLRLLSQVYQLTAFDLTKHGEGQLALLAADRGMLAAQQAADPLAAAGGRPGPRCRAPERGAGPQGQGALYQPRHTPSRAARRCFPYAPVGVRVAAA